MRIQRAGANLENAPSEKRRALFENLIQFVEFHPTKLRLGLYTIAGAAQSGSRSRAIVGSHTIKVGGEGDRYF